MPAVVLVGAVALLVGCGGESDGAPPMAGEAATPELEEIPVEPLPDTLPEPFIFRGDELQVEETAAEEIIYVVEPGDSLALIAEAFGVSTAELQRLNGIADPRLLRAGDELRIPVLPGTEAERIAATLDEAQEEFSGPPLGEEYVIQPGDTLSAVAQRFGLGWPELATYNRLSDFEANNLTVGSVLIIPPPKEDEEEEVQEPPG